MKGKGSLLAFHTDTRDEPIECLHGRLEVYGRGEKNGWGARFRRGRELEDIGKNRNVT